MTILESKISGVSLNRTYPRLTLVIVSVLLQSCSLLTTRPVQEMSETSSALRAAKEVQADTLAPELFRQASEYFFKAKREYKFKNFDFATIYAKKARRFAEDAEFEALKNGGNRTSEEVPDPLGNNAISSAKPTPTPEPPKPPPDPNAPDPNAVPTPEGTPVEVYEKRKAEEDALAKKAEAAFNAIGAAPNPAPQPSAGGAPGAGTTPPAAGTAPPAAAGATAPQAPAAAAPTL